MALYKGTAHTFEDLKERLDALDTLGKCYVVTAKIERAPSILNSEATRKKWVIEEVDPDSGKDGVSTEDNTTNLCMHPKDFHPDIYVGSRKSGKTTRLLLRAYETKIPILVQDNKMKRHLESAANRIGLHSVKVLTLKELEGNKAKKVIIDEAQLMLEHFIRAKIDSMSITSYEIVQLKELQE
ncbi:hypothetical protein M5X06_28040 [Paenibacillus alvei]|uniref:Replication origin-binding protein domain-containing protein n=1 Tax=Paenibacillus alvei TaxID=44250 RepID=A0ABT4GQJ6_PAEAL|nr:hypothetical protein [Paenibacillus alvei]MCY9758958.1 hypothetical protein [Paenibacillus alvei]MCY9770631.1 hypothetical protein [Paenibacillus alvei]